MRMRRFKQPLLCKKEELWILTAMLAIVASKLSLEHRIPMADSIILATAKAFDAVIWTQDSDFKNIV
jgi:predicted nuclease of predicted toxin-antitoxin system